MQAPQCQKWSAPPRAATHAWSQTEWPSVAAGRAGGRAGPGEPVCAPPCLWCTVTAARSSSSASLAPPIQPEFAAAAPAWRHGGRLRWPWGRLEPTRGGEPTARVTTPGRRRRGHSVGLWATARQPATRFRRERVFTAAGRAAFLPSAGSTRRSRMPTSRVLAWALLGPIP